MNEITSMQIARSQSHEKILELPNAIEAEQQLLGALLNNNDIYEAVSTTLASHHFYDPVHARIFEIAESRIKKGALASPVTMRAFLEDDEGLKELGGASYLIRLSVSSISTFAVREYAQIIYECAIRRELIELGHNISDNAANFDVSSEVKEQIVEAEQRLYDLGERGGRSSEFISLLNATTQAINIANAAYKRDGKLAGLSTGFVDLDRKLGGLRKSDLLVLAGRPSMGKTALATNIAFKIAQRYKRGELSDGSEGTIDGGIVGFFSLEMSADQLANRILSDASNIPSEKVQRGELNDDEVQRFINAAQPIEACPLYIDDTPALRISQISNRARRIKRTHGLDFLVIDYLQLIRPEKARENRVNEISEVTQGLKAIAKELDIPVLALSQLSRQVESREDKRPQLSDLRESGTIEQDSDVVMFVFREEYYADREKPSDDKLEKMAEWQDRMAKVHGKAEVIIGKQRHGPIGTVQLSFEGQFTRFGNLAYSYQQPSATEGFG